jgi:hypothetical protein
MSIKGKSVLLAVGALGLILAGAGPALAQHSGGGGGHAGGGGGHAMGGGHAAGGHVGGGAHYAGGAGHFAGGGHVAAAYHGGAYGHAGFAGRPGFVGGHGYSTGFRGGYGGWRGSAWRGGYWRGGFWPGAFYGPGFAWFLPILPLAYATYWYSGIPYYYANDVYYTWNPTYDGYVATDPPPVGDSSGSADAGTPPPSGADNQNQSQNYAPPSGPGPGGPVPGQIFMYPKNGQSTEQQAADRSECQKWATDQAGQVAQNGSDYNRAMVACVEGRGYSAR